MNINTVIADTSDICICYNLFIPFEAGPLKSRVYPKFVFAIEEAVIVEDNLDCYGHTDHGSHFCKSCYGMIIEGKIPKFGSAHCINVSPCQKYLDSFSNLTLVEKSFIACAHSVISIIKLKPNGSTSSTSYY